MNKKWFAVYETGWIPVDTEHDYSPEEVREMLRAAGHTIGEKDFWYKGEEILEATND